jgi:cyclophilin family peptidyl-prolyl cis-trans isomerase
MLRPAALLLALAGMAVLVAGCGGGEEAKSTSGSLPEGCKQAAKPPPNRKQLARPPQTVTAGESLMATVDTSCGSFEITLDTTESPRTVNSFVYLARKGFYDDIAFHRIVPGFIVQAGDPLGNGTGGPGYSITEAPPGNTTYRKGAVAMAKTPVEPEGRSGSQFFIVTAADAGLAPQYAILGEVTSGFDAVKRIDSLGDKASGQTGTPKETVVIRDITVSGG